MRQPSRRLDPRVRVAWWATAVPAALGVIVGLHLVALAAGLPIVLAALVSVAPATAAVLLPPLVYRRWRYEIRARDLFTARGFLFSVHTLVPFDRIQYVESRQGPIDRMFDLTKLLVYTAGGHSARIPGLGVAEAEALREELSRVAGTASV